MKKLFSDPTFQVLFAAGLILAASAAWLQDFRKPRYLKTLQTEQFWNLKSHGLEKVDFVVIGDSRVYRGVDPEVISSHVGGWRGLNLGYSSGGFGNLLLDLAESRLDPRGARVILIGLTPHAFTEEAARNDHLKGYLAKPLGEALSQAYVDPLFEWFAPLSFDHVFRGRPPRPQRSNYIEEYRFSGFVASDFRKRNPLHALPAYVKTYSKYKVSRRVEEALLARVADWKKSGIRVLAFELPVHPSLKDLEMTVSGYRGDWIRGKLAALKVPIILPEAGKFESYDGSHLTAQSAREFSHLLGKFLGTF